MEQADMTVIGAGVIGLARLRRAAQVAREGLAVFVLEKNPTFGQETSSRNSGVIHAGIYYEDRGLPGLINLIGIESPGLHLRSCHGTPGPEDDWPMPVG